MLDPNWLQRILRRHRMLVLAGLAAVTVAAAVLATGLEVSPDMEDLLPASSEAVQSLRDFRANFHPDLNSVALLVEGPTPEHNRRAAEEVAEWLRDRDDVEFAEARRPAGFFQEHWPLYLETSELRRLADRVEERVAWEKKEANPLYVSVEEEPPEIERERWKKSLEGLPDTVHFRDEAGERYVVFAEVAFGTMEFDRTERFRRQLRDRFDREIGSKWSDVELAFSGRHFKQRQQRRALRSRMGRAAVFAVVGVILFLVVAFRDWRAPLLVGGPLAVGTIWAFGWAELAVDRLTVLSASLASILVGLGVDYGVHLLARYRAERDGSSHDSALTAALSKAGPPCLFAALTTALAFGVLMQSSLPAFVEFGLVGAGGTLLILVAYLVGLPALLGLERRNESCDRRSPAGTGATVERGWLARFAAGVTTKRGRWGAAAILILLVGAAGFGARHVDFDDSFRAVFADDLPAFRAEERIQEAVGIRQQPAFLNAEGLEHNRELVETLRERRQSRPNGELIGRIVAASECIPADQEEKVRILEDLQVKLVDLPDGAAEEDEKLARFRADVEAALEVAPVVEGDLPERIQRRFFRDRGGDPASVIAVLPSRPIYSASMSQNFVDLLSDLPDGEGGNTLDAVAYERLMPAIVDHLRRDAAPLLGLLLAGLLLLAFAAAGSVGEWVETVGTLVVALATSAGLCGLIGVEFNLLNVVALPIWFGLGLDALFHLNRHPPPADPTRRVAEMRDFVATLGATATAFATTMIGFGALALSGHPGLASVGRVTLVGLPTIWAVSILVKLLRR